MLVKPPFVKNEKNFENVCANCLTDKEREQKYRAFHEQELCDRCGVVQSCTII